MYLESTEYAQVTKVEGLGCQLGRVDPRPCTAYPPGVSITLFLRTTLLGGGNGRSRKNLGDFDLTGPLEKGAEGSSERRETREGERGENWLRHFTV